MRLPRRRYAIMAATAAIVVSTVMVSGTADAAKSTRASVAGTLPRWAQARNAVGNIASGSKVSFNVVLPMRDASVAAQIAASVSNPNSPDYGHYLTPSAFNSRFAPTSGQVSKVRAFLKSQGFSVSSVATGNRLIEASGSVAAINRAFGVTLRNYSYKGKTLKAPDKALSVPVSIKPLVAGVTGLDDSGLLRRPSDTWQPKSRSAAAEPRTTGNAVAPPKAKPCSTYWGQYSQVVPTAYGKTSYPTWICGYTPKQMRSAYDVPLTGRTGKGVTVAVIDAYGSPTMLADANRYAKQYGDPQFATGQYTEHLFKPFNDQSLCGGEPGWNGEETLDVESVHAMATGANVLYVGAQNCDAGLDSAINWVIQNNAASIVSNSWGSQGEDGLGSSYALESSLFVQAKAEGIGFYFSSGDDGDNALIGNTATPEPDYPSSDANVTAVGGTSLAVDSRGNYQFETSWGSYIDDIDYSGTKAVYSEPLPGEFWHGTGGGTSTLVSQPDYQAAVVPSRLSAPQGGAPMRVVPDVAANADPFTGFNVGQTINGVWEVEAWGGTSLACPVFAGIQALASQGRTTPIGFANPMIYKAPATAFHDVKAPASQIAIVSPDAGFLVPFALDSSLDASRNYDDATGRGSPIAPSFIAAEGKPSPVGSPGPWPRSQFKAI